MHKPDNERARQASRKPHSKNTPGSGRNVTKPSGKASPAKKRSEGGAQKERTRGDKAAGERPGKRATGKPGTGVAAKHGGKAPAAKHGGAPNAKPGKASKTRDKAPANHRGKTPAAKQAKPQAFAPGKDYEAMLAAGLKFCPHARECGACATINEPYEESLQAKDDLVAELFAHLAPEEAIEATIGMENPFHYRNKVISPFAPGPRSPASSRPGAKGSRDAKASDAAKRKGRKGKEEAPREILCGMYAQGTHRIVDTRHCLVENEQAKAVVQAVRDLMRRRGIAPYDEDAGTGFLRHAVIRRGHNSEEMLVTLVTAEDAFPGSKSFCRELVGRCPFITTIVQNVNPRQTNVILGDKERTLYGPGFILDTLCGLSFRISSQSFYQVNARQTEVLYDAAIDLAGLTGAESVIDAYCGTGTLGLVAAKRGAREVVGVDTVESAIRDARENARHNGVTNARFEVGDAGAFMHETAARGESADVLLMDPPRAGASEEFLRAAVALGPRRIVYVSCNPRTQARDCDYLAKHGYHVARVRPVDMFPHTAHVETVVLLERK